MGRQVKRGKDWMKRYDVIVVGGGSAGLGAAISAGRAGASTLLVERYGVLGGTATMGLTCHWDPIRMVGVRGLALEYYEAMKASGHFLDFPFDEPNPMTTFWECGASFDPEEYADFSRKLLREAGVELLLHTMVTGVRVDNGRIRSLNVFHTDSDELTADLFIDASGDAVVAYLAGAPYEKAPAEELQAATLMFRIGGVDNERMYRYLEENPDELGVHPRLGKMIRDPRRSTTIAGFQGLIAKARANGDVSVILPEQGIGFDRLWRDGEFRLNCTHTIATDCTAPGALTQAQLSESDKTRELIRFFNRYIPGCEGAYLDQRAPQIGVRESRRIVGDYRLTEDDIAGARRFGDAVVEADWAHCDTHSPDGKAWSFKMYPGPYQIPYRCFLPKGIENLYVAGRCVSCDRAAFASIRIQLITMTMGQAVGTAAALACRTGGKATRQVDVAHLQQALRQAGHRI